MAKGNRNKSKSENGDKGKGNWKVSPKNLLGEGNHLKINGTLKVKGRNTKD